MAARNYTALPTLTTLSGSITAGDTTITVASAANLPAAPFVGVLDRGLPEEEVVLVTANAAGILTVTRGYDDTTATSHPAGAQFQHAVSAIDFREANDHIESSAGVHGVSGAVVGTTDAQTLINKILNGSSNTFSNIPKAAIVGAPSGSFVGHTDTQTLTNKTLSGSSNTFSNIPKASVVGMPSGTVVGHNDSQVLSNKTIRGTQNTLENIGLSSLDLDDTGWRNVSVKSGFAAQSGTPPQVRRILGNLVIMRWGWSPTGMSINTAYSVGTIPVGYRPDQSIYPVLGTNNATNQGQGVITPTGDVEIRTGSPLASYFLFNCIWFTD